METLFHANADNLYENVFKSLCLLKYSLLDSTTNMFFDGILLTNHFQMPIYFLVTLFYRKKTWICETIGYLPMNLDNVVTSTFHNLINILDIHQSVYDRYMVGIKMRESNLPVTWKQIVKKSLRIAIFFEADGIFFPQKCHDNFPRKPTNAIKTATTKHPLDV